MHVYQQLHVSKPHESLACGQFNWVGVEFPSYGITMIFIMHVKSDNRKQTRAWPETWLIVVTQDTIHY